MMYSVKFAMQTADEMPENAALWKSLETDAQELKRDLAAAMPKAGAYLSFSHMNDKGIAGYVYDWSENKTLDDSKPLDILAHVGSQPAFFVAGRDSGDVGQYEMARKWMGKTFDYVNEYAPGLMEDEHQAQTFRDVMTDLEPILKKIESATSDNLLPATTNGQVAIVLDFSSKKPTWHQEMPPSDRPLPLPALAVVIEVHDADKIKTAGAAYLESAQELLDLVRAIPEAELPDEVQILPPQKRTQSGGEVFYYPIPSEVGLDESIFPHALLTKDWLVFSYSDEQSARLMGGSPPDFGGPLADTQRPAMAVSYYDNRQVIDALYDWAKYGLQISRDEGMSLDMTEMFYAESDMLLFDEEDLMESFDQVVDLLKCFRGYEAVRSMRDGAQVTEYQLFFEDVSADR